MKGYLLLKDALSLDDVVSLICKGHYVCLYVIFISQTTREEFEGEDFQVRRRYNDFLWLRQRLEETQPIMLVPVSIISPIRG